MLATLKNWFDAVVPPSAVDAPADAAQRLHVAAAVLLVEVMRADGQFDAAEQSAIASALQASFGVPADTVQRLIDQARLTADRASDTYAFTSRINEGLALEEKLQLVEHMWQVAYADGTLSAHENHLMRRIADLLYLPHGAYVHAKMRARDAAGARRSAGRRSRARA